MSKECVIIPVSHSESLAFGTGLRLDLNKLSS